MLQHASRRQPFFGEPHTKKTASQLSASLSSSVAVSAHRVHCLTRPSSPSLDDLPFNNAVEGSGMIFFYRDTCSTSVVYDGVASPKLVWAVVSVDSIQSSFLSNLFRRKRRVLLGAHAYELQHRPPWPRRSFWNICTH
jgi:hypothetical protein